MINLDEPVLLQTKISLPNLKDNGVPRERLIGVITAGLHGRLTSVCSPAGFGKTTLLAQWAHTQKIAPAWLSLDDRDNDIVRFWRYLIHAVSAVTPRQTVKRLTTLTRTLPHVSILTILDGFLNELANLNGSVVLILDDYHFILHKQIHDSLSYFVDHLPHKVHLLISSRSELPFSTVKWLSHGEYKEIDASFLQFTSEETAMLYQVVTGAALTPAQIEQLNKRTEGWVTGLKLVALSLDLEQDPSRVIDHFDGRNRNVADYLFHEVVAKLPPDLYRFLLQTSVLLRMNGLLCDAVMQGTDGSGQLDRLSSLNLFLVRLDNRSTWFRYHHLFGQFLQELAKKSDPEEWLRCNRRASEHCAAQSLMDEAVHYAIEAEDFDLAQAHLRRHIRSVLRKGELDTLLHWFNRLPSELTLDPALSIHYAQTLVRTQQPDLAERELKKLEQLCDSGEVLEDREQLWSGMLYVRSLLLFTNGDLGKWIEFVERMGGRALPTAPSHYDFNYNTSEPLVRRTIVGLKGSLSNVTESAGNQFTQVLESHGWQHSLLNLYVKQALCEGYYEWNRLDRCRELLQYIERAPASRSIPGLMVPLCLTRARLLVEEGRIQQALDLVEETLLIAEEKFDLIWARILLAFRIRLLLQDRRIGDAKKEIARLGLSAKDRPTYYQEFQYVTLARFLGAMRKEGEAIRLLEVLQPQSEREQVLPSMFEISCVLALLNHQRGHRAAAMRHLGDALVIGERNRFIRSFLDEGAPMAELLKSYLKRNDEEDRPAETEDYVRKLLGWFPDTTQTKVLSASARNGMLTPTEIRMLMLIRQGATNQQMADALSFSQGTIRVYLTRVYEKLGVSSRTQALIASQELDLIDL
jgi:LuxR family maltose regulon positive regulatory protein